MTNAINIKDFFAKVPNFPKAGIMFYDISPLLLNAQAWQHTVDLLCNEVKKHKPDVLVALDSRGFLLGSAISYNLGIGLTMVRKKGKLPGDLISYSYNLEYGTDVLEVQKNAIQQNQKVLILDDVLATGGTIEATVSLLTKINANVVGALCIMELVDLKGRERVSVPVTSLVKF